MEQAQYTWLSWLHITSAVIALVLGLAVLFAEKGTRVHRSSGRAYGLSMVLVNLTAFGIYRLFGGFGPFHVAALVSLLTLLAGSRPVLRRPRSPGWLLAHMNYMYWSVVGLYAAFASEIMVRLPIKGTFIAVVATATATIMVLAGVFQKRFMARWASGAMKREAPPENLVRR